MWTTQTFFLLTTAILSQSSQPNVVFILTDDQDVVLEGMTPLKQTKRLVADEGVTFTNAFAVTPICCPSRSSILTGLYLHNHNTVNNSLSGGCSSRMWQSQHENRTFAVVLQEAGYRTFYAGKYLNQYGAKGAGGVEHIPRGWHSWVGLVGNSVYYNYTLSVNGSRVFKGDTESDYLTDVLKDYSLEFLKNVQNAEPFFMMIAPPAPHEPFTPAIRHKGKFKGFKAPRTKNFNVPVNNSKHWLLRLSPDVLPQETVDRIDEVFQNRWESLLSVDELVQAVLETLLEKELLSNTYVVISSDHGFHLGQFGLPWDKRQPYETDIRIPLIVRGPDVPKGVSRSPVLSIDIAASILDMAGVQKLFGDGKSFLGEANSVVRMTPRNFLLEYRGEGGERGNECYNDRDVKLCTAEASCKCFDSKNNTFTCIRRLSEAVDDVFCVFDDEEVFEEYYDMRQDPQQMNNLAGVANRKRVNCLREAVSFQRPVDECTGTHLDQGL